MTNSTEGEWVQSACPSCGKTARRQTYDIGSGPELSCAWCEWCWGAEGQSLKPLEQLAIDLFSITGDSAPWHVSITRFGNDRVIRLHIGDFHVVLPALEAHKLGSALHAASGIDIEAAQDAAWQAARDGAISAEQAWGPQRPDDDGKP